MAVQPLDQRLDKLNQAVADTEQRAELASTVAEPQTLLPREDLMLDDQEQEQPDAVQVAGGKTEFIKGLIKSVKKKAETVEPRKAPEPTLTPEAQQALEIEDLQRAGDVTGVGTREELNIAGRIEQTKVEGMTPEAVVSERQRVLAAGETDLTPPQAAFNLPKMGTEDDIRATIAAIDNLDPAKPKKITFDEIKTKAEEAGIGPKFIDDLFSGRLEVNPQNTYKALNAVVWANKHVNDLANKVATGTATPTEVAEMMQTVHFSHFLQQEVKNFQTNIAQSLAVMRMPRDAVGDITNILVATEGTDPVKFAQAYLSSKTPEGKAALIKSMAEGNVWEKMFGVFVNGLLYRPGTHIRNFLSNTLFVPYRMVERSTAAGIGGLRQMVGLGSSDRYVFSEVPAMISSSGIAIRNGWDLAAQAWKTGVPKNWTDPTKIARQQTRMELINNRNDGSLLSAGIKGLNFITTLPGRSLMTADEFFKGINYTHELAAEATRTGVLKFEDAIKNGSSFDEAQKLAEDAVSKLMAEPPEHLMQLSEVGTFTQKLEGFWGQAQQALQPHTAGKMLVRMQAPFISAPVNIIGAYVERSPFAIFSSNVRADLAKVGTKESDMALAKIGLGSAAMFTFSEMASSGFVTGSGPGDKGTREAMMRQGWQPYSFVIDVGDNRSLIENKFPGMARFGTGDYEGKVFISYQGLEPVGAILGVGADYYEYAKYEQDDSRLNAVAGGMAFGFANYIMTHPFLQGVADVSSLFGGFQNPRAEVVNSINKLAEMLATDVRKGVTLASGAITSYRQLHDPLVRDISANPNLPAGIKGLAEAFNKFKNETPGLSETLQPKLNLWSEPVEYEYAWAPFRMKAGKQREVDVGLIQLNVNQGYPTREISAKDPATGISAKVKLDTSEYNQVLRIANDRLGLEDRISTLVRAALDDPTEARVIDMQKVIKSEFEEIFEAAKKILLSENEDLQQRLNDHARRIEKSGQGAR
jgi:hypothetical protein